MITIHPHCTVAVVAVEWAAGSVDWYQVVIDAKPVALGIAVGKQAPRRS